MHMEEKKCSAKFVEALDKYVNEGISPFDVPGHHMGNISNEMISLIGKKTYQCDVNAPVGLDNLAHPTGVIKAAEEDMARTCHSDHAFFLINGTSSGLLAAVMTVCKPNEKIILPRNVHKSVTNALVISGAVPVYVAPQLDTNMEIANQPSLEDYKKAINRYPSSKAVVVINPTYFGVVTPLKELVDYAHKKGMIVIADEAHGAHYYMTDKEPLSAMDAGADIAAVSFHKTAGSLTQSSVLLLKGDKVSPIKIQETLNLINTTSPSNLLIGSLDAARAFIDAHGASEYDRIISLADYAYNEINKIPGFKVRGEDYFKACGCYGYDKTKLLIELDRLDLNGYELYRLLKNEYHIQIELAETYVVLCILALGNTMAHITNLIKALKNISKNHFHKNQTYPTHNFAFQYGYMLTRPRTAFFAPSKLEKLENVNGCISKESIVIYPPGIPVILPGEIFTSDIIEQIKDASKKDCTILSNHFNQGLVEVIDETKWKRFSYYKNKLSDFVYNKITYPRSDGFHVSFEGDNHDGTIILLPFRKDVWRNKGADAFVEFKNIIFNIAKFEKVFVGIHPSVFKKYNPIFQNIENVYPFKVKYNDSWARDNTLIFVKNDKDEVRSVDFRFNAWGGTVDGLYSNYQDDDALGSFLTKKFNLKTYKLPSFVLEGGSIAYDGKGTLIVTEACLLSKGRNPQYSKNEIEEILKVYLGVSEVIWIPHGIIGDETNEHVDNIVAFARPGTVLLSWPNSNNKAQYQAASKALKILENSVDASGNKLNVIKIKMPSPIYLTKKEASSIKEDKYNAKPRLEGDDLLASYINFYQSDKFVLLPQFGVKEDLITLHQFESIFPDKKIIPIYSKEILIGGGNIHCVTMQIPKGALK